jgi:hypothetical protein
MLVKCKSNPLTNEEIAKILNISMKKINWVKKRFVEEGLDTALDKRKANRSYAKKAGGDFEAHLIALSCGDPPEGFSQWSLRLLADKIVALECINSISHYGTGPTLFTLRNMKGDFNMVVMKLNVLTGQCFNS